MREVRNGGSAVGAAPAALRATLAGNPLMWPQERNTHQVGIVAGEHGGEHGRGAARAEARADARRDLGAHLRSDRGPVDDASGHGSQYSGATRGNVAGIYVVTPKRERARCYQHQHVVTWKYE